MADPTRIPTADVTGVYGALVKLGARRMLGKVPDSVGVMGHHRRVMLDLMSIGRKS